MAIIAIRCPECHGDVRLDESRKFGICACCGTKVAVGGDTEPSPAWQVANLKPLMESYLDAGDLTRAQDYARKIISINGADADVWYTDAVVEICRSPDMLDTLKREGTVPGLESLRNYEILSGRRADPADVEELRLKVWGVELTDLTLYCNSAIDKERWAGSECRRRMMGMEHIDVPPGVTSLAPSLFEGFDVLRSVSLPSSVTSIGSHAFSGCSSLASVTIPDSVTSIGGHAFSGCSSLASVKIPDSVTSIAVCTFFRCTSLASIRIPASVASIGNSAFEGCTSLASVTFLSSTTRVGSDAFKGCPYARTAAARGGAPPKRPGAP